MMGLLPFTCHLLIYFILQSHSLSVCKLLKRQGLTFGATMTKGRETSRGEHISDLIFFRGWPGGICGCKYI